MPPEVAALEAEKYYTCVEGNVKVSAPELFTDVFTSWSDSLNYSCVDDPSTPAVEQPTMTVSPVGLDESPDVEISSYPAICTSTDTVPLAVDAGVLVFRESSLSSLSISPSNLSGILNGTVTNWTQLASDNPGTDFSDLPLTVMPTADSLSLDAIKNYLVLLGQTDSTSLLTGQDHADINMYSDMPEGAVAIVPMSYAVSLGLTTASVLVQPENGSNSAQLASPDLPGIYAAGSQWVVTESSTGLSIKLDPSATPEPAPGFSSAPPPYQAIYPVNYYSCSSTSMVSKAVGKFFLRLDSQGALGASNYAPLPEKVRIASLVHISKGLPTPKPTATQ
jgi:ABC-type phosphate transport system substrate-binding protein